jgi:23S rRNA (guanine2445-N2)-methyltransferase / 23S rRNA (guanine2069-N7)-methyltransferase
MYGSQLVKDAMVDRLRERRGSRPSVAARPDFLVNCRLSRGMLDIRIDLSGYSLHERGYRREGGAAPLRENLAAALLIKSGWQAMAASGGVFLDLLCGSGTLVIEAALMASDTAPGLGRGRWGFNGWLGYDENLWLELTREARDRHESGLKKTALCYGFDASERIIAIAKENARRANMTDIVWFDKRALDATVRLHGNKTGLIVTNPPYGKRIGEKTDLKKLYAALGDVFKSNFEGWDAAVFTGEPELGKRMGLRALRVNVFFNGPLKCRLLQFRISPEQFVNREAIDARSVRFEIDAACSRGADAFFNRLKKNQRTIGRWAKREGISCYRVYDADLPEYSAAIDIYGDWSNVQEYAAPSSIDPEKAKERLNDMLVLLPHAFGIEREHVVCKVRRRQKGKNQYEKHADSENFIEIGECGARFLVNLNDYLDTGLFLDHRPTRKMIGNMADGTRFLNLFCYTGSATVYAALGGARSTTSVDMSATYLAWARRNLLLNGISGMNHRFVQEDCLEWIASCRDRFDLIFLDPPTFSNSKRMNETFDVQRDHAELITAVSRLLARGGTIVFSINRAKFKLDEVGLRGFDVKDITSKTIPHDFARNPRIHSCWLITLSNN